MTPRWTLYSCFYDCKSFSWDAIDVRKVYTNIACNFRDGPLICEYRTSNVKLTLNTIDGESSKAELLQSSKCSSGNITS